MVNLTGAKSAEVINQGVGERVKLEKLSEDNPATIFNTIIREKESKVINNVE